MSTDWGALMDEIMPNQPQKADEGRLFQEKPGTNPKGVGTDFHTQGTERKEINISVPSVPGVPCTFEEARVEACANHAPTSYERAPGVGGRDPSAPSDMGATPACLSCEHFKRPGLSDGLCGGDRLDLPPAYGPGHPLRRLPGDGGADCSKWVLHWSFPRVLPRLFTQGTESPGLCVGNGAGS